MLHDQVHFVIRIVVDDFFQSYDVWMVQHFVNVDLSHGIDVRRSVVLAHDAPSELLHDQLLHRAVLLAQRDVRVHRVSQAVQQCVLVVGRPGLYKSREFEQSFVRRPWLSLALELMTLTIQSYPLMQYSVSTASSSILAYSILSISSSRMLRRGCL